MRATSRRIIEIAALGGLWWGTAGSSGGCSCSGGTPHTVTPPPLDVVWCNIQATQCNIYGRACEMGPGGAMCTTTGACEPPCTAQDTGCTDVICSAFGGGSCDQDFTQCNPATCTTVPANAAGQGDPQCFNHTKTTAAAACAQTCNPTTDNPSGVTVPSSQSGPHLNPITYPAALRTSGGPQGTGSCVTSINVEPEHTDPSGNERTYNMSDSTGPYLANGCLDPGPDNIAGIIPTGTNAVRLGGSGMFISSGNGIDPQNTTIKGGYFNISAPSATCDPATTPCNTAVNAMEILFDDFDVNVNGQGSHPVAGLTFELDDPFLTAPGQIIPPSPPVFPDPEYMFTIPQGVTFDSVGTVDGTYQGLTTQSDQPTTGMIDLVTGQVSFDFEIGEPVNGTQAMLTGSAFTTQIVDVAPVVTAAPTVSANATTSCSATTTLTASATSVVGLPVTFFFSVDGHFVAAGSSATVTEPIGTHSVSLIGIDSLGEEGTATETLTVNDETAPAFNNVPGPETVQGCTNGTSGPVPVTAPTAVDVCSGVAAMVGGSVVEFNGATVSIPVVNGTVSVPSGTGVLQFVATNANGVTSKVNVPLTVLAPPTIYGAQGVMVDNGSIVNGTLYSGAGPQVQLVLQNDAHVGSVFSLAPVVLQDRVHAPTIDGSAGIALGHVDVIGSTSTATPILPAFPIEPVTFTGTQVVQVNPPPETMEVVTLAPGQYGAVTVFSGGKLILSAGYYQFRSLDLEPQGQIVVTSSTSETARVFVENSVIYRGSTNVATTSSAPPPAPLFLVYTGTSTLTIGSSFTGTIVAPNATLSLQSLNNAGVYTGEFFAKQVTLFPNTTLNSNPFTCQP